jgi:chain length determinant protein tyrosine kinase EpsG
MAQPHIAEAQFPRAEPAISASQPSPSIGDLLRAALHLSDEHERAILDHQKETGLRFGESAVALRLAQPADVLQALARQYRFPYPQAAAVNAAQAPLVMAADPFGAQADAFRELRSVLLIDLAAREPKPGLALVSAEIGDGKSYVAANLAVAFSQLGARTLLIDADMRAPRQHEIFAIEPSAGLSAFLAGRCGRNAIQPLALLPGLHVLPAGPLPPNPTELLQGAAFDRFMADALRSFDHVMVDTPAAARGADALIVAAKCGTALVVARKGQSRMRALQGLLGSLAKRPAAVAGVLVNEH